MVAPTGFDKSQSFGRRTNFHTITIEKDGKIKKYTVRPWMAASLLVLVACLSFGYLGATGYLLFRDDLIGATMARQAKMQNNYETRIATLRTQLDRVTSRQLHDQQVVETKIDRLLRQQESLDIQQQYISSAAERAKVHGITPPSIAPVPRQRPGSGNASLAKKENFITGSISPAISSFGQMRGSANNGVQQSFSPVLLPLEGNLQNLQAEQFEVIGSMIAQVHQQHGKFSKVLSDFGVRSPKLQKPEQAMGGPFIPVDDPAAFDSYLGLLHQSMDVLEETKRKLRYIPFSNPLPGHKITSGFGTRIDPFRRRAAMHSGLDFKASTGARVRATGAGKVIHASRKGGYGRMVAIRHPSGHVTRYAHLSRISVRVGVNVDTGTIIGRVGSTGRSTGPHLHYEVRIGKRALNPKRFLRAGRRLGL